MIRKSRNEPAPLLQGRRSSRGLRDPFYLFAHPSNRLQRGSPEAHQPGGREPGACPIGGIRSGPSELLLETSDEQVEPEGELLVRVHVLVDLAEERVQRGVQRGSALRLVLGAEM